MISCTEFIPAYSELFKFMDQRSGRQAVYKYWAKFFDPDSFPLGDHLKRAGLRGCWDYWSIIFREEACDSTMFYHEKEGWFTWCMHRCPSKDRFRKLGYLTPFDEYCLHCDGYNRILESAGLQRISDDRGQEAASCRSVIIDPKTFRGNAQEMIGQMYRCETQGCCYESNPSGCPLNRPGVMVQHCTSGSLCYLHPQFHINMEIHIEDVVQMYGKDGLLEYLAQYTTAFHKPLIEAVRKDGLAPLRDYLLKIYEMENASDALNISMTDRQLHVKTSYSPAIRYMKEVGHVPQENFEATTSIVYGELARQSGVGFEMISYDTETGGAEYCFRCHTDAE